MNMHEFIHTYANITNLQPVKIGADTRLAIMHDAHLHGDSQL